MSVLETMQAGLIPMITDGCNFPEVFEKQLAIKLLPNENNIKSVLNTLELFDQQKFEKKSKQCINYVNQHYTTEIIAREQYQLYKELLS